MLQQKKYNYQHKKLVYYTTGHGAAVVLLHGFGEDASIWKNQYEVFTGYKLIIPDLPGSGQSEMIVDMSIEGMADAVEEIIQNEIGLASATEGLVVLVGHSMGGYITLAIAEKKPRWLNGFGLFHSTAYADSEAKKEARINGIKWIKEKGATSFLAVTIPKLYSAVTKNEKPGLIEEQLKTVNNFSAPALVNYYEAMMNRKDRTDVLSHSNIPVLFIIGREDTAVPFEDSMQQCHLPDLTYIHVLEKSGHMGMVEEIGKVNEILLCFICDCLKKTN